MQETKPRSPLGFALLAYMLFVTVVITLLPFRFEFPPEQVSWKLIGPVYDIITNALLFLPIGFLYRLCGRKRSDRRCLRVLAIGLSISFLIELTQFLMPGRITSLTDLLANGVGTWVGALFYDRVKQRLNERLVGQLALELPLMSLFYLLTPLLWINGLATGDEPSRLWLAPLLGLCGGSILSAVWTHRLKPTGMLSENTLSLVVGAWFFLASIPGFIDKPVSLWLICGLAITIIT